MTLPSVQFGNIISEAVRFSDNNISKTYRALVSLPNGSRSQAIIKDIASKEMANELISFVLARALSLPVPELVIARVIDPAFLRGTESPTSNGHSLFLASLDVNVPSIAFRYRNENLDVDHLLAGILAWPNLGRLFGFDTWIANVDRHPGNLLFTSGAETWLIDHGYAFTGPSWQGPDLDPTAAFRNRLTEWLTNRLTIEGRRMRTNQVINLCADLEKLDLNQLLKNSFASHFLHPTEFNAVTDFLVSRIAHITRIASHALKNPVML